MALADFFGRSVLAASQVLRGFDPAAFGEALSSQTVGVAFDDAAASSVEGRITLEMTINLLSRLYPRLAVVPDGAAAEAMADGLVTLARAINPRIQVETVLDGAAVCLAVGDPQLTGSGRVIYVGSGGWVAHVSTGMPVGSGATDNPFGAAAAACFGAANAFRAVFSSQLSEGGLDENVSLSLLAYAPSSTTPLNPELGTVDLGEVHLVGLGAIGNGAVWALSKVPGLSGRLHLVDHEQVDLTNLQRYVLASMSDVGASKVALAKGFMEGTGLEAHAHPERWGAYLAAREDWQLETVAVAVDSAEDRIGVQASLPRWVFNAWTQPADLGVSRHALDGAQACLACLYLPKGERKSEATLVAEAIGLPNEWRDVGARLLGGIPTDRPFLERVAGATGIAVERLLPFEGRSLRDLYVEGWCGRTVLGFGEADGHLARAEVPMAFQSALAGVMLAAELVAHATGLREAAPPVTTRFNLLRPLAEVFSFPVAKDARGSCICQDEDFIDAYRAKHQHA